MATPTSTGTNRTGMDMSPMHAKQLLEISKEHAPPPGDESPLANMRRDFFAASQPIGTVPPPGSVKGMAKTALETLKGHKPTVLVDKLGERLAFERTGVRLYESVLTKFDALGSWDGGPTRAQLMQNRDEELAHFEMVTQYMQKLGADPTAMTPSADVVAVISSGVLKAITDPRTTLAQALQALLVAERADIEGWQGLIQLARELGHEQMARDFQEAERAEQRHGVWVRQWLDASVLQDANREIGKQHGGG